MSDLNEIREAHGRLYALAAEKDWDDLARAIERTSRDQMCQLLMMFYMGGAIATEAHVYALDQDSFREALDKELGQ